MQQGLAVWGGDGAGQPARLIVRGRGGAARIPSMRKPIWDALRDLFDDLETKEGTLQLLDLAEAGPGVRIFIGSENKLFSLSGSSLVIAP